MCVCVVVVVTVLYVHSALHSLYQFEKLYVYRVVVQSKSKGYMRAVEQVHGDSRNDDSTSLIAVGGALQEKKRQKLPKAREDRSGERTYEM